VNSALSLFLESLKMAAADLKKSLAPNLNSEKERVWTALYGFRRVLSLDFNSAWKAVSWTMAQWQPTTVLVGSLEDPASRNLASAVIENHGFQSTGIKLLGEPVYQKDSLLLAMFNEEIVRPPALDEYFNPQAYIFLSRHSAESGIPALTAHTTGNFSMESELGGIGRELAKVNPSLLKNYMISLSHRKERVREYHITVEATHHGPTSLLKPVLFVEIGASEKNWNDREAAKVVADALVESLAEKRIWEKTAVAVGGTHYPDKFNRLLQEGEMSISFVVPRYSLEHIDEAMMGQMLQKTAAPVRYAALDWKGLGSHKDRILKLVQQFGLEVLRL
jgi:D-aminoacyl-tRNA deacylase